MRRIPDQEHTPYLELLRHTLCKLEMDDIHDLDRPSRVAQ
jgi:hypothetical protein